LGLICMPTMPSKPWLPLLLFDGKASCYLAERPLGSAGRRIGMANMPHTLGISALLAAAGLQNERWHFLVLLDERSLLNPTDSATKRGYLASSSSARTSIMMMTMQVNNSPSCYGIWEWGLSVSVFKEPTLKDRHVLST
jgi:hypothetical protein